MKIIDVSQARYHYDLFRTVAISMDFPQLFGYTAQTMPPYFCQNLDALWDCLTDLYAEDVIVLRGFRKLPPELHKLGQEICQTFREAAAELPQLQVFVEDT